MSEKTEQPTKKRREDGVKEGQVIKSVEITSGVQLLTMLIFFHFFAEMLVQHVVALIQQSISMINQPFSFALGAIMRTLLHAFLLTMGGLGGMLAAATIVSITAQVGFILASKAVGVRGTRLNPVKNLKQIFSIRSLVELVKSCLKVMLLCLTFLALFYAYSATFQALPYCDPTCALPAFSEIVRRMWYAMIAFYVVLGAVDYLYQRHHTLKQQRMSKEDIKREYKEREGDPRTKSRRRQMAHELQSGSLAQNVRRSSVIVRNPTHIAVCLGYHPVTMPVPCVLEKGTDARAEHIAHLAQQAAIPIVENVAVARALFYDVKCGERIPEMLFEPVAALLRLVLQLDYSPENPDSE